jgi:hypothetical protein
VSTWAPTPTSLDEDDDLCRAGHRWRRLALRLAEMHFKGLQLPPEPTRTGPEGNKKAVLLAVAQEHEKAAPSGPIYQLYGNRAQYRWGDPLAWARSRTRPPRRSTSEPTNDKSAA